MVTPYRPDIARVAEETIANLKGLEAQIEVLRNGLAWLCQSIGQPDAARWALTPSRGFNTAGGVYGIQGAISNLPFGPIPTTAPWVSGTPALPSNYVPAAPASFVPVPTWIANTPFGPAQLAIPFYANGTPIVGAYAPPFAAAFPYASTF